ncbi:MAG: transposase [Patescibacteria group bacterium]
MVKAFKYRICPTKSQEIVLRETLERLRELYNAALQERRDAYQKQSISITAYRQMKEIVAVREIRPEYGQIHTHLLQDAITRLDRAFQAFFRRCKSGEKPGYPRFRGRGRYRTFTFKDASHNNGVRLSDSKKRIKVSGIGNIKIKLHRPIDGKVKQVSITLGGDGHWYAIFSCVDISATPLPKTGRSVGIDVGISTFAALSDGTLIANPRPYESAQKALAKAQRVVSRRKNKKSNRRRKAIVLLAKQHDRVRRVRLDFHHKTALNIVRQFDSISVENLNVKGLAKGRLAKQVHDAAWAQFTQILESKAASAAREFFRVNPRGTSQECSSCGAIVKKSLSVRIHVCPECGLVEDRDINASKNIKRRGHRLRALTQAEVRPHVVREAAGL